MNKPVFAYAIADTDGGRKEPVPLLKHIYPDLPSAAQARDYRRFDSECYPIVAVEIRVMEWNP